MYFSVLKDEQLYYPVHRWERSQHSHFTISTLRAVQPLDKKTAPFGAVL